MHLFQAKKELGVDLVAQDLMQEHIALWQQMYADRAPWLEDKSKSLSLPSAIAHEIARLVTVESKIELSGSRGEFLTEQLQPFLTELPNHVEYAAAGGTMAFKPYVDGNKIAIDCVPAWQFLPIGFNAQRQVTDAVFLEFARRGKKFYTRMERHTLTDSGYCIRNTAYSSYNENDAGTKCTLSEVDEWASLEPEITLGYKDGTAPEKALFGYFRIPFGNHIDPASPLGVSVFSRAEGLIQQADLQYGRILWEYEGGELAVHASEYALKKDESGRIDMPKREERLFRGIGISQGNGEGFYSVFSPAIRDTALYNGLNQLLRRIEFNCGLSYGTLSDPQNVDKTAEEIKSSKQRSYSAICAIQESLQSALEQLVWAMDFYATLYRLAPMGDYETTFTWGDGVLENTETEFMRRKLLVDGGYLKPELLLSWYFGTSEEKAKSMIPDNTGLTFE